MKKKLITRINLSIDYDNDNQPIIENHVTFEVIKETKFRYYFKGRESIEKKYFEKVIGTVECNNSILNKGKKTVTTNLSVYFHSNKVLKHQQLIREAFILGVDEMKRQIDKFHRLYAHGDILSSDSEYVKVSKYQ